MWGFEHGVNECGLAIGNEALWSRLPGSIDPGLLGMDLLRLALERASTADEALEVLIELLELWGQSGRASFKNDLTYHNSFIIADGAAGWIMETAGRHWAARRVDKWGSISNVYSIHGDYDRISAQAIEFATRSGWYDPARDGSFSFASAYEDAARSNYSSCAARFISSQTTLGGLDKNGAIRLEDVFALLRSHGVSDRNPDWRPGADGESMLCMHATSSEGFETAASMVAQLPRPAVAGERLLYWASLASPCLSSFVPIWPDAGVPPAWTQPATFGVDEWWDQERTQRLIEQDYASFSKAATDIFAQLERRMIAAVRALPPDASVGARAALTTEAVARHRAAREVAALLTKRCACGVFSPQEPDPRGSYLEQVNATIPETFCRPA
jgi:dipeptidase